MNAVERNSGRMFSPSPTIGVIGDPLWARKYQAARTPSLGNVITLGDDSVDPSSFDPSSYDPNASDPFYGLTDTSGTSVFDNTPSGGIDTNYGSFPLNTDVGGQTIGDLLNSGYTTEDINSMMSTDMGNGVTLGDLTAAGFNSNQIDSLLSKGLDAGDLMSIASSSNPQATMNSLLANASSSGSSSGGSKVTASLPSGGGGSVPIPQKAPSQTGLQQLLASLVQALHPTTANAQTLPGATPGSTLIAGVPDIAVFLVAGVGLYLVASR